MCGPPNIWIWYVSPITEHYGLFLFDQCRLFGIEDVFLVFQIVHNWISYFPVLRFCLYLFIHCSKCVFKLCLTKKFISDLEHALLEVSTFVTGLGSNFLRCFFFSKMLSFRHFKNQYYYFACFMFFWHTYLTIKSLWTTLADNVFSCQM